MTGPIDVPVELQLTTPPTDPAQVAAQLLAGAVPLIGAALDASIDLDLPGIRGAADHFGAAVLVEFRAGRDGDLLGGFVALGRLELRPPQSISIALAPPLPGGGRLENAGPTRYRGAIGIDLGAVIVAGYAALDVGDPVSVAALLSGTFRPPIQLSFGFTLVGVGGVVGINRRIDTDALSAALSSGELGAMLFPSDPVGQADSVLPALDRCFPVSRGDFFVGPMLKLGWGTPTLVSATLAFIVGTDGVVIIGQVRLSLPCEDAPFALFNVIVMGVVNSSGVAIDGSLVNSRIGPVTLDGDARFRLTGGQNGTMALSVGGFHPKYTPPPGMSGMKRLAAELSPLPIASIRLEGYCALTTETAQLGGAVFVRADLAIAAVDGHASFDAIIAFSPFHFRADFHASLALELFGERVAGVSVSADFSGPGHWELNGSVTIEILWFDIDVDLHLEWGSALDRAPATDDPVQLVANQLRLRGNWAADAGTAERMVVLGGGVPGTDTPLSPSGALRAVQMAAPLDVVLTRIGGARLAVPVTVSVEGGASAIQQGFSRGLYVDVDESTMGASGALQAWNAGVVVGEAGLTSSVAVTKTLDFEDALLSPDGDDVGFSRLLRSAVRADSLFEQVVAGGAAARRRDALESTAITELKPVAAFALLEATHG